MKSPDQIPNGRSAATTQPSFRLYVAGQSPNSALAETNLRALWAEHWTGPARLELIDVLKSPARALADGIVVTPTLVRLTPTPRVSLIGALTDTARVRAALGLAQPEKRP